MTDKKDDQHLKSSRAIRHSIKYDNLICFWQIKRQVNLSYVHYFISLLGILTNPGFTIFDVY